MLLVVLTRWPDMRFPVKSIPEKRFDYTGNDGQYHENNENDEEHLKENETVVIGAHGTD